VGVPAQSPQSPPPQGISAAASGPKDLAWEAYFANPANFWDNRHRKTNPKAPDFKNKSTNEALWLNGAPDWVHMELAAREGGGPPGQGGDALDDNPPF
jgi:hypothetical protein